jgi:hypothetical protein
MFTSRILGHDPEHIFNTEPVCSAGFDTYHADNETSRQAFEVITIREMLREETMAIFQDAPGSAMIS